MNLKYYLRGLGIGIVLTAILLGITAGSRKEILTDEEIITRAKSLGMVEETVLNDSVAKAKDEVRTQLRSELKTEVSEELEPKLRAELEAEYAQASVQEQEAEKEEVLPQPFEFSVSIGETPYSIGERLADLGMVTSADAFDSFLVQNGYDRSIVAAKYVIPGDADMDLIARIITGENVTW